MIPLLHPFSLRARWLGWALLCPWLAFAQTNDQGALKLNGQITSATCQFVMSESNVLDSNTIANANSSLTMKLGTVPLTTAQAAAVGATFGPAKTVYFFTKSSAASLPADFSCSGGQAFDVGLTLPSDKILNTGSQTLLLSSGTADSGAVGGVALSLKSTMASTFFHNGAFAGTTPLNLTKGGPFGVLLSGNNNLTDALANLGNGRVYGLTSQFVKTSNTVTAGAYAATIVVNMWWR